MLDWRKLPTADDGDLALLEGESRLVLWGLMRVVDDAGRMIVRREGFEVRAIARRLGIDEELAARAVEDLEGGGFLEVGGGSIRIIPFERWQARDTNAERCARHRRRQRAKRSKAESESEDMSKNDDKGPTFQLTHPDEEQPDPALRLWERQEELRRQINPAARGLKPSRERLARVRACLRRASFEECEHVLAVYADEARQRAERGDENAMQYFNGVTHWRDKNFDRALSKRIGGEVIRGDFTPRRGVDMSSAASGRDLA
jgi:hypothetical protein